MTGQDIFELAMDLMRKRSASGAIDEQKTASYKAAAPGYLTIWQNENIRYGNVYSKVEFSNYPAKNLFGDRAGLDIKEYDGKTALTVECDGACTAYYFEIDGPGTVYVEDYTDQWNVLKTVTLNAATEGFVAFKGSVTPTQGATKSRLRFTGNYCYRTVNRALFDKPFAPGKEPDYRPWIKKQMPDDFYSWDKIVEETGDGEYNPQKDTKREGKSDFYISYWYQGTIRITYVPAPPPVPNLAARLMVDDVIAISGAYFLAAQFTLTEDPDSANFFSQRYEEYLAKTVTRVPATESPITDAYGGLTR